MCTGLVFSSFGEFELEHSRPEFDYGTLRQYLRSKIDHLEDLVRVPVDILNFPAFCFCRTPFLLT